MYFKDSNIESYTNSQVIGPWCPAWAGLIRNCYLRPFELKMGTESGNFYAQSRIYRNSLAISASEMIVFFYPGNSGNSSSVPISQTEIPQHAH